MPRILITAFIQTYVIKRNICNTMMDAQAFVLRLHAPLAHYLPLAHSFVKVPSWGVPFLATLLCRERWSGLQGVCGFMGLCPWALRYGPPVGA